MNGLGLQLVHAQSCAQDSLFDSWHKLMLYQWQHVDLLQAGLLQLGPKTAFLGAMTSSAVTGSKPRVPKQPDGTLLHSVRKRAQ